jgi:hypothetical protein
VLLDWLCESHDPPAPATTRQSAHLGAAPLKGLGDGTAGGQQSTPLNLVGDGGRKGAQGSAAASRAVQRAAAPVRATSRLSLASRSSCSVTAAARSFARTCRAQAQARTCPPFTAAERPLVQRRQSRADGGVLERGAAGARRAWPCMRRYRAPSSAAMTRHDRSTALSSCARASLKPPPQ